ncbi:hypothetical protein ACHAWF_017727 [Thalassiosira exigua]
MEDNDDYEPDESGHLDLRYRGWTEIEPRIWSFAHRLLKLDISFNQLEELPAEITKLQLLEELNCACNKLRSFPQSLASMVWLRVIKANGNSLASIPKEVGQLKALELLNLSENVLASIPLEVSGCASLSTLLLQNNDLPRLPLSLATLSRQMKQMDISNNSHEMAKTLPPRIHRDAQSIMWILALQQEKRHRIDRLKQDSKLLQHNNIATERDLAQARERIASLEEKKRTLEDDMESVEHFLVVRAHCREFRRRCLRWWEECKRACAQKIS